MRVRSAAGGGVVVLADEERLVGLCEFGPTEDVDDDARPTGHLFRLFIERMYQNMGGGRLLVDAACGHLRALGFECATLWVLESDGRARGFYEHLGWQPNGGRRGEPVADVRYALILR